MRQKAYLRGIVCIPVLVLLWTSGAPVSAEVIRLPFFPVTPIFSQEPEAFPWISGWFLYNHTLNQNEAPDSGHCYEQGAIFTFFSCGNISFSGLAREMFQFKSSPLGDFYLWARDLVTDLRLYLWYDLDPIKLGAGYRHDCKHDVETEIRTVIHDAFFIQILIPPLSLPVAEAYLHPSAGFNIEAEYNVTPIFQTAESEPDRGRISVECELIPVSLFSDSLYLFADGRCSWIYRENGGEIPIDSEWNIDGLFRTGIDYRAGKGDIRLSYCYERITDDWASLTPLPENISSIEFLVSSHF